MRAQLGTCRLINILSSTQVLKAEEIISLPEFLQTPLLPPSRQLGSTLERSFPAMVWFCSQQAAPVAFVCKTTLMLLKTAFLSCTENKESMAGSANG